MADWMHKTPLFDFEKGEFVTLNGHIKTVIGKEALKVWIQKVLRTELNNYEIYIGTGYGTELETHLIGRVYPKDYIRVEIGESVKTTLLKHDNVTDVKINNIEIDGNKINWNITVYTDYGVITDGGET